MGDAMKRSMGLLYSLVSVTFVMAMFQNCSRVKFGDSVDSVRKADTIHGTVGNGSPDGQNPSLDDTSSPEQPTADANVPDLGGSPTSTAAPPPLEVPVWTTCSDVLSDEIKGNVKSSEVHLAIFNMENNMGNMKEPICRVYAPDIREGIINSKKLRMSLRISECPGLTDGNYMAQLQIPGPKNNGKFKSLHVGMTGLTLGIRKTHDTYYTLSSTQEKVSLIYDYNARLHDSLAALGLKRNKYQADQDTCDEYQSPLIVRFRQHDNDNNTIELSPPTQGILFDLKDEPGKRQQISWIKDAAMAEKAMFLVRPNSQGVVAGINEMFGNRTLGPDGLRARDGFHALRKFDMKAYGGNEDRRIDAQDRVFSELRFWSDKNVDGITDVGELRTLAEMHVTFIDLDMSVEERRYVDTDQYGNLFRRKSIVETVKMENGIEQSRYNLITDIWFRIVGEQPL